MSHDQLSSTFDQWADAGRGASMESGHGDVVGQVIERMHLTAGDKVLDLGCGTGWATRLLAKSHAGVQAVGLDVSPKMVAKAEEEHSYTIRARYEVGPFEELEHKDGEFQRVFSMEAVYYSIDLPKTLSEIHRVLAPGGTADIVVDFYADNPGTKSWAAGVGVPMHWLSEEEWAEAFRAAGFGEVETKRVVDRRGAGDPAAFEPSKWYATWEEKLAVHEAGSLWIHATRAN
jgi:SAM-dependent methyltransferase